MPARLSPQRRRFIAVLVSLGFMLLAPLLVVAAQALDDENEGSTRRRSRVRVVVLLHGYGGGPSNMSTIEARVRRLGLRTVNVALPSRGEVPIAESVRAVDDAVRASGATDVDLVGYSLGGVVARAWVASDPETATPRRVVTLGSPHHGAALADTAAIFLPGQCAGACADLRPGSSFLRDLNDDETPGDGVAWTSVWTALDRTVTPPESSVLDGAINVRLQDVCPDSRVGHGSINRDALPVGLVALALQDLLTAQPRRDDCASVRAAAA